MLSKFHKSQKGFTLIELMIVVVIIGILAALAIPRFMRATTKSKQSEAKQLLKQIYTMQQTYKQANDTYWIPAVWSLMPLSECLATLGVESADRSLQLLVTVETATTFTARLLQPTGLDDDVALDTGPIDQKAGCSHVDD
jgi:prepilin-type N-terminal cleavage/methylation domain-containing protein